MVSDLVATMQPRIAEGQKIMVAARVSLGLFPLWMQRFCAKPPLCVVYVKENRGLLRW